MTKNEIEVLENLQKTYREAVELICKLSEKGSEEGRKAICDQLESNCEKAAQLTAVLKGDGTKESLESIVTNYLIVLGVPSNLQGYSYLRTAIILAIKDNSVVRDVTERVYKPLANQYGTTISRVERSIRYAIEISFKFTTDQKLISQIFGVNVQSGKRKLTNVVYIAGIADYVLQKHDFA